jgi:hypothetical protein
VTVQNARAVFGVAIDAVGGEFTIDVRETQRLRSDAK